ncbi:amino acid--tRNA ligase-related protein [Amycolatopsis sp. NPDC026612]|uniref:amino acid--tRNA ligase-related protein n=1 Tax=Amycolatopsis sp. NPDC026612 TaxID=3155466 RepID=UPI0033F1AFF1
MTRQPSFGAFVARAHAAGRLVVQPRMGFAAPDRMRAGLAATRRVSATTVGTVTLDSYTRLNELAAAERALAEGVPLNGYPILAHGRATTRAVLDGIQDAQFPVQVRHGAARPQHIIRALIDSGLDATEGGPVSYCLPYSRIPLRESVEHWARSCELLAALRDSGAAPHVETFGGCMLGQLCPPSMLVAISVLEGLFFAQHGLRSLSLSYAQQTDPEQDEEAIHALRRLAGELLPGIDLHVVVYAHMGMYPRTAGGARRLLADAARLAVRSGAARLIVKTVSEAHRIPTIEENVTALELAGRVAAATTWASPRPDPADTVVYTEARSLVEAVLDLDDRLRVALPRAFELGRLDIPYCLHPDNPRRATCAIDRTGRLRWADVGSLPLPRPPGAAAKTRPTSAGLLASLSYVQRKFDLEAGPRAASPAGPQSPPRSDGAVMEPSPHTTPRYLPPPPSEHLASAVTRTALRVQQQILVAARAFLHGDGFTELLPPVIGPVTDPGIRGSKQLDVDFYGHRYKLMTSGILYKQASLLAFDKLFFIAPNVRAEPPETSSTSRHLVEFHQIDVEISGGTRADARRVAERLLVHIVRHVLETVPDELASLGRDPMVFTELLSEPFEVRTHAEAVAALHDFQHPQNPDAEIDWQGEELLSHKAQRPFFITDYPKGSRGFYDRESTTRPGVLRNFDLIAPGGYGELVSGSERESDYATIVTRMRETGENPAKYGWYLDMVRAGIPASAGFGMGLERLTRYLTGLDSVWQVSAYPKIPGLVSP